MGPNYQQQATAFEIHNGRSALAAGTALYAPHLPLAIPTVSGSIGWRAVLPRDTPERRGGADDTLIGTGPWRREDVISDELARYIKFLAGIMRSARRPRPI